MTCGINDDDRSSTKKLKEVFSATAWLATLIFILYAFSSLIIKSWKEYEGYRNGLVVASEKSPAHHFLVTNWLECSPMKQTRAECYASIRGAAAIRGDSFVHQVDAAAMELKLI
ncbi:MAG: hypothetical protein J0I91_20020 [Candidatus Accumulibacter sp.]|nr:hypothetical protein [Accumulibacter sp.]